MLIYLYIHTYILWYHYRGKGKEDRQNKANINTHIHTYSPYLAPRPIREEEEYILPKYCTSGHVRSLKQMELELPALQGHKQTLSLLPHLFYCQVSKGYNI